MRLLASNIRQLISIHSDGSDLVECIKFSSDGRYLAFGSRDNNIYIYQVSEEYRKFNRIGRCSGHSSFIATIGMPVLQANVDHLIQCDC